MYFYDFQWSCKYLPLRPRVPRPRCGVTCPTEEWEEMECPTMAPGYPKIPYPKPRPPRCGEIMWDLETWLLWLTTDRPSPSPSPPMGLALATAARARSTITANLAILKLLRNFRRTDKLLSCLLLKLEMKTDDDFQWSTHSYLYQRSQKSFSSNKILKLAIK